MAPARLAPLVGAIILVFCGLLALAGTYLVLAALAFIAAGLLSGAVMNLLDGQPCLVQVVLWIMTLACLCATVVFFQSLSFACIFPGMPVAFADGMMLGSNLRNLARRALGR